MNNHIHYLSCTLFVISFCLMFCCSFIGEEAFCREMFEEYISQLKEQEKENERKQKEEKV